MRIVNLRHFAVFSVVATVAMTPFLVLPAMVGVLVDNAGMSESSAGWSASLSFLASAVTGFFLALRIHHLNLRRLATIALAMTAIADLLSAYTAGSTTLFFAVRIAAGVSLGMSYVAAISSFARFDGYERGFGVFVTLQFVVSGLGLYIIPIFADQLGAKGLFLIFVGLDCCALLLARYLPAGCAATTERKASGSELKILLTASALFAIIGFALFEAANNAQFTYIERFGVALELSDHTIGFTLLIASLIGIPGAFAIVVIGHRFGTTWPLVFGIGVGITGLLVLLGAESYGSYFFGNCCMGFSWAFCLPYIQTLLASIDRNGSAIAAGTSFSTLGGAFGPGLAAMVVTGGAYDNVFMLAIGLFIITLIVFYYAGTHTRNRQ